MTNPTLIVGAGLAGLIAAHAWPNASIVERADGPAETHRALLRFRSDAVSQLTGVEFRRVRVHKGIWFAGEFRAPDIRLANLYARKVTRHLSGDRSIWNLDPVDRWVAPEDLYEQLLDAVRSRVRWGERWAPDGRRTVSTAPLSVTLNHLRDAPPLVFSRAPITVRRYRLPERTNVYQTVYFPAHNLSLYRASITGDLLIMEYAGAADGGMDIADWDDVSHAFGLAGVEAEPLGENTQSYGKIAPIEDDAARKHALFRLSQELNVYSLGRFATWRNILLDDVVHDIAMIKRLLRGHSGAYDMIKEN